MSATVENPTTVRELTEYVSREHPDLDTTHHCDLDQLLVVGTVGLAEPPAALREILGSDHFELRDEQVTGRNRWVAIVNPADGKRGGR